MRALTTFVSMTVLLSLAAACAGTTDDEDSGGSEADITASQAKCAKVDRTYSGPGKVTATTTGVKCYDDRGVVAGSMGAQAGVTVAGGVKTGADKNPGRVKVTGTNTVDHTQLTCWISTDYLCKGQSTQSVKDAGPEAEAGGHLFPEAGPEAGDHEAGSDVDVCGLSIPASCGSSSARTFISQCSAVGGSTSNVQTDVNGSIGAGRCMCDCTISI